MDNLLGKSISIILENQAPSGAYIASPNFLPYRYCWFRDGSFTAYAMDLVGEKESAQRFHDWAAARINEREHTVEKAISRFKSHLPLAGSDYLYTRYKLDGSDALDEDWPNFQLDGFGTWLWALNEHRRINSLELSDNLLKAASLTAEYLEAMWPSPCFDCWEENPDQVHPYTLAAIYGGLAAHGELSSHLHTSTLGAIRSFILDKWAYKGYFVKFSGSPQVDASLLGLSTPYRVFEPDSDLMKETARQIEIALTCGGGIRRYDSDTYYGGGEWVLLSAWAGWHAAESGDPRGIQKAHQVLDWVENQFQDGGLPEQIPANLNNPAYFAVWNRRWGKIALPLLWSHANHIILKKKLG